MMLWQMTGSFLIKKKVKMNFINYSTILLAITSVSSVVFSMCTIIFFTECEMKKTICCLFMATILFSIMHSFNIDKIDEWQYGQRESIELKLKDKKQKIAPIARDIEELENKLKELK